MIYVRFLKQNLTAFSIERPMADQHQKTSSEDEKINNIVIKLTVPGQDIFGVCKYLVLICKMSKY